MTSYSTKIARKMLTQQEVTDGVTPLDGKVWRQRRKKNLLKEKLRMKVNR